MSRYDKKFYWLKLKHDFFKRHDVKIIRKNHGDAGVLFYLNLLCESLDHNGALRFSEKVPYTAEMLAAVCEVEPQTAADAMETLKQYGLLEVQEDGTIYMTECAEMTGSETGMAKYMRDRRAADDSKLLKLGHYNNVTLAQDELDRLKEFYPSYWSKYIDKMSYHKESTGRTYESDFATIMGWLLDDVGQYEEVNA